MGLRDRASAVVEMREAEEKLTDVIGAAGTVDLPYAVEGTKVNAKAVMSAAMKLQERGVLEVRRRFLGVPEFISDSEVKPAGGVEDLLALLEEVDCIPVWKAAAKLKVPVWKLLELACELEDDGLVTLHRPLLGGAEVEPNRVNLLLYRLKQGVSGRRLKGRVIYSVADYLLALAERTGGLKLSEAQLALGLSLWQVGDLVAKLPGLLTIEYSVNPLGASVIKPVGGRLREREEDYQGRLLDSYDVCAGEVPAKVRIISQGDEPMPLYVAATPYVAQGTRALLKSLAAEVLRGKAGFGFVSDPEGMRKTREGFLAESERLLKRDLNLLSIDVKVLAGMMLNDSLGFGCVELLLQDDEVEQVSVNTSNMSITAFHRRFGWVKTNISGEQGRRIHDYLEEVGGCAGDLDAPRPLVDVHLPSGDKVAAVRYPVSGFGDTVTVRKYPRQPWSITHYLSPDLMALNTEMAAFLWMCVHYGLNVIVGGGARSGKTSMLNCILSLMEPTQRVITVEDRREINLPQSLKWNWIPLTTTDAKPDVGGGVGTHDLLDICVRMAPDMVVLGELRDRREVELLYDAAQTGHTVYSSLQADTAKDLREKLIEAPFGLSSSQVRAFHLFLVVHRVRGEGRRRVYEMAEVMPAVGGKGSRLNILYRLDPVTGEFVKVNESRRIMGELVLHTGLARHELLMELDGRQRVLEWMLANNIRDLQSVSKLVHSYYFKPQGLLDTINAGLK
jgi:flagellar protein FlaI